MNAHRQLEWPAADYALARSSGCIYVDMTGLQEFERDDRLVDAPEPERGVDVAPVDEGASSICLSNNEKL